MKSKRLLRFYYSAERLNRTLDNLILRQAQNSAYGISGEKYFERVAKLVEIKCGLSRLWRYINGVISSLAPEDVDALKKYARLKRDFRRSDGDSYRAIKRAISKFERHAYMIGDYKREVEMLKYYDKILKPTEI